MSAHTRMLNVAVAAVFLLSAAGCVCVVDPSANRGDVTFLWTFNGRTCAELQEITQVSIQIPGQSLQNAGRYDCITGGTAGIKLLDFKNGTYNYAIQGRNTSGTVLYENNGSFTVRGDTTVSVDLQSAAAAPGAATITWTFPPNGASNTPNCTQAGVTRVDVSVDDQTPTRVNCVDGFMTTGVLVSNLLAGAHTIDLTAVDDDTNNFAYYHKRSTLTIVAGATVASAYTFDWAVGSMPLKWTINDGSFDLTCAQAGITEVYVNLRDTADNYLWAGAGTPVPCSSSGIQGTLFVYLSAGSYRIYLQGYGTGNVLYSSNTVQVPSIAVTAGLFPVVDSATPSIVMVRQ